MKRKLSTFIPTLALWFILVGRINIQTFMLGTMVCWIISIMLKNHRFRIELSKSVKKGFFLKIYYIVWVMGAHIYDVFLSAIKLSRLAFEIRPSFFPRIITIKTAQKNVSSIAVLANFITLTQGSLVIDFDTTNRYYFIHWIDAYSDNAIEVKKDLVSKHENLIAKIWGV